MSDITDLRQAIVNLTATINNPQGNNRPLPPTPTPTPTTPTDNSKSLFANLEKSFSGFMKGLDSAVNKIGVTVAGFAAVGLHDTVQGAQLTYQFQRLAYEIADSLLPVIKDFTKGLAIVSLGMHKINQGGGNGVTSKLLEGAFAYKIASSLGLTGVIGRGAMSVGRGAMSLATPAVGAAVGYAGGAAALGVLAAPVASLAFTLYESMKVKAFNDDFSKLKWRTPSNGVEGGWYSPTGEKRDREDREKDLVWHPEKYDKSYLDKNKDMIEGFRKKYGDAPGKEREQLQPIMHTSFGAVDKLWEQMQALTTEHPENETAEKQLGVLGGIALTLINILEFLEHRPFTTKEEALKA